MVKKVLIILCSLNLFCAWHWLEPKAKKNNNGVSLYQKGEYVKALESFLSAKGVDAKDNRLKGNVSVSLYKLKKYKEALEEISGIEEKDNLIAKSEFSYNKGNIYYNLNNYSKALESYKEAIVNNSKDIAAKRNYEITLKKIKEQQKKQEQKKEDKKNQNQKQKQEQEQKKQKQKDKYKDIMKYLNEKDKEAQKKKKKQKVQGILRVEKDW